MESQSNGDLSNMETHMTGKEVKEKIKKTRAKAAPKTPKAKKAPKPKKESSRAPRIKLSEKDLSEAREVVRLLPAVLKMVDRYAKEKKIERNEAAEKMILVAAGRLGALSRYAGE